MSPNPNYTKAMGKAVLSKGKSSKQMETFTAFRGDVGDVPETSSEEDPIENKEIDDVWSLAQINKGLVGRLREVTKAEEKRNVLRAPIEDSTRGRKVEIPQDGPQDDAKRYVGKGEEHELEEDSEEEFVRERRPTVWSPQPRNEVEDENEKDEESWKEEKARNHVYEGYHSASSLDNFESQTSRTREEWGENNEPRNRKGTGEVDNETEAIQGGCEQRTKEGT